MVNIKCFEFGTLESNVADGVHGGLRALRRLNRKSAGQSSWATSIITTLTRINGLLKQV